MIKLGMVNEATEGIRAGKQHWGWVLQITELLVLVFEERMFLCPLRTDSPENSCLQGFTQSEMVATLCGVKLSSEKLTGYQNDWYIGEDGIFVK